MRVQLTEAALDERRGGGRSSRQSCNLTGGIPAASIAGVGCALNIAIEVGYAPHTTKLAKWYAEICIPYKKGRIFQRNPIFKMPFDPSVRSGQAFFAQGRLAPTPVEGMYHLLHKYRTASPGKGTFKVRRLPPAVGSTWIAVPSLGRIHSVFSVPEAAERSTDTWPP